MSANVPNVVRLLAARRRRRQVRRGARLAPLAMCVIFGAAALAQPPAYWPAAAGKGSVAVEPLAGRVSVVDGDTLDLHGQRIRLWGIDAPESRQLCERDGKPWRCGQAAALALDDRIAAATVRCERRDVDRWGRLIALCRQGDEDLGRWLVRNGHALAFRRYSLDYVADEDLARGERIGVWRGAFALPWEWRKDRKAPPLVTAAVR